jgi:hypothetical protein
MRLLCAIDFQRLSGHAFEFEGFFSEADVDWS